MLTFQTDILIRGKKAEKYQELKAKYNFELVDIYMISGVLGFINNQKDINENDSPVVANLPRSVLQKRSEKIEFLCEIITMSDEIEIDSENAMRLAFEDSSSENPKKLYKRELFDEYAMGGIDIFYKMMSDVTYDKQVDNIRDIIEKFIDNSNVTRRTSLDIFEEEGL